MVEATLDDVRREPRLLERPGLTMADAERRHAEGLRNKPTVEKVYRDLGVPYHGNVYLFPVAYGAALPCPFLGPDNLCGCHETKPADCAAFEAGSEQCQEARLAAGLPALAPDA